ncbi:alpha,alpha-trehalose-phosphate synthase (UDP-forming) [Pelagibacterium xiamenense]|uniref:alpha,alpha-trehalose-phosphate synthase (UDP-forming) n=1 Tax=Pelagibacterium xiamenense TaxID=2901140 RepID=UPI001E409F50|nr:trehalose-6-phosphate synthase [Pelagibacterium xiamenense]MCD7060344.1 trehalose-6-phosphate synthase [Pelagibacterium xiamenense]
MSRLIIVSNRIPGKSPAAGGLAVALKKTLSTRDGFWFGWSGSFSEKPEKKARFETIDGLRIGQIDLTRADHAAYYAGFSNSILWPAFHLRLDLTDIQSHWYEGYRGVNAQFADALVEEIEPGDIIWVHDYHLIPLATELRRRNIRNRIGFYLHIPFPTPDALNAIPHHEDLLKDLVAYDLVGFQAHRDLVAFNEFIAHEQIVAETGGKPFVVDPGDTVLDVFPIGSDPEAFARLGKSAAAQKMYNRVARGLNGRALVLGVDRLDYSKGLPQRISAYEKLLENNASLRRTVHMIQIAPPSRDTIKEYQVISDELDSAVGRVIGKFSEPDWLPLTYVKRAYGQASLAGLYRLARVGLVTPLRDGMNLVAHEYVGAQDPEDPGVLVLSRFAGAAEIFHDALIINPFDTDETAEAMRQALVMPLEERKQRWRNLMDAAQEHNVDNWAESYLDALAHGHAASSPGDDDTPGTRPHATTHGAAGKPGTPRTSIASRMPFFPWLRSVFS